ncbi:MAG TPA: hypothetical protein VLX29_10885, partial [Nitrospirota bacterium]|nr:hypothetical protein [Nitrospirota bacterium]
MRWHPRRIFKSTYHMELSNRKTTALNKDFVSDAFSGEEAVSIFAGEWASKIPGYQSGGAALLF